jgi:dUTP pyrophosphatase
MLKIKVVSKSPFPLPAYETAHAAGLDLRANLDNEVVLASLQRAVMPTGLFLEIPHGYEAQVRPRSGLAAKQGVTVLNSPGTIDSDYRGELKVILVNLSHESVTIHHGDRIAQLVVAKHETIEWETIEILSETKRGAGGFGSTGHQ